MVKAQLAQRGMKAPLQRIDPGREIGAPLRVTACEAYGRPGLRARLAASPLLDHARFARGFETALRQAWRDWCERK